MKTSNFKLFKDDLVFSLIPVAKQKGLDYSIFNKSIRNKKYKAVCSSVIYGPNASGKTNIISALDTFKQIILRGHINNEEVAKSPNLAAYSLELIPNITLKEKKPVSFYLKFVEADYLIEYSLILDLGNFLDREYDRKILKEELYINTKKVFSRKEKLEISNLKELNQLGVNGLKRHFSGVNAIAASNLDPKELFLMNGFKTMFSAKIVFFITSWLEKKLTTVCSADRLQLTKTFKEDSENSIYVENTLNQAAKSFGINSNNLGFAKNEEGNDSNLVSIFDKSKTVIPANIFESYGTIRFVNMFPLIIKVLVNGGILVVDEFDASIHPNALINIINIFHNDEINKNHAQLIFNTHNPIFLNSSLFRRDEIKFVERDEVTHCSIHYSLSDFDTSSTVNGPGVRKDEDYLKNYFINKYGAIVNIDFSDIIANAIKENKGN